MNYEEYLNIFNELKSSNLNVELLDKLKNTPLNNNVVELLEPKYMDIIMYKFSLSISKIKNELSNIFDDVNYLDLTLVNFKKDIKYILEMININILQEKNKESLLTKIQTDTENTYDILIKEANYIDQTGMFAMAIKNNKIKWS